MIIGAHTIISSTNPGADRAFLRDSLKLTSVDAGGGWLIFGLPPAEVAVHPAERNGEHEFFLMCDDVEAIIVEMSKRNIGCDPLQNLGWGLLTRVVLPGGGKLGIYQPRHARPRPMGSRKASKRPAKRAPKKPARKITRKKNKKKARRA